MRTREPLAALADGKTLDLRSYVRSAPMMSDTTDALDALEMLRDAEVPMALIHDEYGHFEGIVTPADILEAIAGVFRSDQDGEEPKAIARDDGSWLLAGWMPADEMADQLGITLEQKRDYQTVGGFVLAHLRRMPATGEHAATTMNAAQVCPRSRFRPVRVNSSPAATSVGTSEFPPKADEIAAAPRTGDWCHLPAHAAQQIARASIQKTSRALLACLLKGSMRDKNLALRPKARDALLPHHRFKG